MNGRKQQFTINQIDNGWILNFYTEHGESKQYFFESYDDFLILFEKVFKSSECPVFKEKLKEAN